jgi:adenylylsulfate reductase subunit A
MAVQIEDIHADIVIAGGGSAGLMAAIAARRKAPKARVTVVEKAHVDRSGCLAMGLNAINLYIGESTPEAYVDYVARDNYGIVRRDLLLSIAENADRMVAFLESIGVPFPKDAHGGYRKRSSRSIAMHGERIKPLLAAEARRCGVQILNHTCVYDFLRGSDGGVDGLLTIDLRTGSIKRISAGATIVTTGGASGIYKPTSPGSARKKTWYSPYNAGCGLALGIAAGAEMTSFEMRFVALRTKDVIAPTGTLAFTRKVKQRNARAAEYLKIKQEMLGRRLTTAERLFATVEENRVGNGPCYMDLSQLSSDEYEALVQSYLEMSPGIVLLLDEKPDKPLLKVEVIGSEPYVNGGHGMAGYWIDSCRRTTVPRLYAAGDVAGGAPKKYLTGCFVEAEIAAHHALESLGTAPVTTATQDLEKELLAPLNTVNGISPYEMEERLQKIMDEYAGGASTNYECAAGKLSLARDYLVSLQKQCGRLMANSLEELVDACDMKHRILVARALVEHLLSRRETRWPCYQSRADFPVRNDVEYSCFINSVMDTESDKINCFQRSLRPPYEQIG